MPAKYMYIIDTNEWKNAKTYGEFIEPRRNHIAAIVGKNMILHGGVAGNGLYLSDLVTLNFSKSHKWQHIILTKTLMICS